MNQKLKIVVIGGSGLIGTKLVKICRDDGHEVVGRLAFLGRQHAHRRRTGGGARRRPGGRRRRELAFVRRPGRAGVLRNGRPKHPRRRSGRRRRPSRRPVGRRHRPPAASGYFRAKLAQENLIKASEIPYTIVRATQFFEFVGGIAESATEGETVRLPPALMQPIVSDDVAAILADIAVGKPLNGTIDIAGPEPIRMDELVRRFLERNRDARQVTTDPTRATSARR